jgi:hypothetical protein
MQMALNDVLSPEPGNAISLAKSVRFEQGLSARLIGIDGTWRRDCIVNELSDDGARLRVLSPITALHFRSFSCRSPRSD